MLSLDNGNWAWYPVGGGGAALVDKGGAVLEADDDGATLPARGAGAIFCPEVLFLLIA